MPGKWCSYLWADWINSILCAQNQRIFSAQRWYIIPLERHKCSFCPSQRLPHDGLSSVQSCVSLTERARDGWHQPLSKGNRGVHCPWLWQRSSYPLSVSCWLVLSIILGKLQAALCYWAMGKRNQCFWNSYRIRFWDFEVGFCNCFKVKAIDGKITDGKALATPANTRQTTKFSRPRLQYQEGCW